MAKRIHMADKVAPDGSVSALCFKTPRAISLRRATWTILASAVTCPKCRRAAQKSEESGR